MKRTRPFYLQELTVSHLDVNDLPHTYAGTSRTIELQTSLKTCRCLLGLKICNNLKSGVDIYKRLYYKIGTSTPLSPCDGIVPGEGGEAGSTLTLFRTAAYEYPHLILSTTLFLSLSKISADFQRHLKFYGPR